MTKEVSKGSSRYDQLPKVVQVVSEHRVVINRGIEHGIENGDTFLVFSLGEEIIDPDSGKSLGLLENVRGKARVIHAQEFLSTLESIQTEDRGGRKRIIKGGLSVFSQQEIIEDIQEQKLPLDAELGDYAKPI